MDLVPQASATYHTAALTADLFPEFEERNPAHYRLFNVRSVVAPARLAPGLPGFLLASRADWPRSDLRRAGFGLLRRGGRRRRRSGEQGQLLRREPAVVAQRLGGKACAPLAGFAWRRSVQPAAPVGESASAQHVPAARAGEIKSERQLGPDYQRGVRSLPARVCPVSDRRGIPTGLRMSMGKFKRPRCCRQDSSACRYRPGSTAFSCGTSRASWKLIMAFAGLLLALLAVAAERRGYLARFGFEPVRADGRDAASVTANEASAPLVRLATCVPRCQA